VGLPMKRKLLYFVFLLFMLQLAGCASFREDMISSWNRLKGNQSEAQGRGREDAVLKYGYKGQREKIYAEFPIITPEVARSGDTINYELQYAILAPQKNKLFVISEAIVLSKGRDAMVLMKREVEKPQGIHVAKLRFTIPKDLEAGLYKIVTTITLGNLEKVVQTEFTLRK
jgi:hypothetical protein